MIPALKRTEAPPGLLFHLGHTWVLPGNEEAVVGIDSFAARLLPCATAVKLVCGGRLLHQGDFGFEVLAGDRRARFLVPLGGKLLCFNERLQGRPDLLREDPYGAGWVLRLRPRRLEADQRNLLGGKLAQRWLEAASEDLRVRASSLAGSVIQRAEDGAVGFLACLPPGNWEKLAAELLHSAA